MNGIMRTSKLCLISMLLALCLIVGLLPITAWAAGPTFITEVTVTNVPKPVVDQPCSVAGISVTTNPADAATYDIYWYDDTDGNIVTEDDTFIAEHEYILGVELKPNTDFTFEFDSSPSNWRNQYMGTATFDGVAAESTEKIDGSDTDLLIASDLIEVVANGSTTTATDITRVQISNVPTPVVGQPCSVDTIKVTTDPENAATYDIYWFSESEGRALLPTETFLSDKQYYIVVELAPEDGYAFQFDSSSAAPNKPYAGTAIVSGQAADAKELDTANNSLSVRGNLVVPMTGVGALLPNGQKAEVTIQAKKVIDGGNTSIGNKPFKFRLSGNGQESFANSDANGNILFTLMIDKIGTFTYILEEVADQRDGTTFNFDKSPKTVTVVVRSATDVEVHYPNSTYYAFEEFDLTTLDLYYYADTIPGNKGTTIYCTNKEKVGPQLIGDVPAEDQTYKVVINPTVSEIEANGWVQENLYGSGLNEKLKKLFYYFDKNPKKYTNIEKQKLVWAATGAQISGIKKDGDNPAKQLEDIYNNTILQEPYNLVFFVPIGNQAQEPPLGHPQPLATGAPGAVLGSTTPNGVVFNNTTIETGKLIITKTLEGEVTAEEAEGTLTFKVTEPSGTSREYTLADFTKDTNGRYTLEINNVKVGEYTVEETTKNITGKTVAVTYTVNGGQETTDNKATVAITKDVTTTVDFKNSYSVDSSNPNGGTTTEKPGETTDDNTQNNTGKNTGSATSSYGQATSPQTGDSCNAALWMALAVFGAAGAVGSTLYSRKLRVSK